MKLTQKQETFCLNLFRGLSHHEAYVQAGYSSKQLPATLDRHAFDLVNNSKVVARLAELRQKAEDASVATVLERKQVLTEIVRGRFVDFMTKLTPEKLKSAALQELRIIENEEGKKTTIIKLHNPIQAADLLNKMEKIYEAEGAVTVNNQILNISVISESAREATKRIVEGEGTE